MKVITTNLLNRFWKNGVKPVKDALATKFNLTDVINNLTTTVSGKALDARQGKVLKDLYDELNSNLKNVETFEFSAVSSIASVISSQRTYHKSTGRVFISAVLMLSQNSLMNNLLVIPEKYRPKQNIECWCMAADQNRLAAPCKGTISTTGYISGTGTTVARQFYIVAEYYI